MNEEMTNLHSQSRRSNEELVAASKNGELPAMEELFSHYRGQVYGVVRRYTDNIEEAEDVVQEAMLRAFVNIGSFRGNARFSSWLITIARNVAISIKRKHDRAQWFHLDDPSHQCTSWAVADPRPTPEQCLLQTEHRKLFQQKFLKLRPKYRTILRVRARNKTTIEETAQALGITYAAAASRLHRAKRMLLDTSQENSYLRRKQGGVSVAVTPGQ
jgi:RNA polymerase sigma-70 factor, ECF subfamily